MALRYNFVTPLTSLIVVQTNVSSTDNTTRNSTAVEEGGDDGGEIEDSPLGGPGGGLFVPTNGGGVQDVDLGLPAGGNNGVVGQSQKWFQLLALLLAAVALVNNLCLNIVLF